MQIWGKPLIKSGGVYGCIVWSWTIRLPAVILGVIESGGLASNRNSFCVSKLLNPLTSGGLFTIKKWPKKNKQKWTLKHFFSTHSTMSSVSGSEHLVAECHISKGFFILFFYFICESQENKTKWRWGDKEGGEAEVSVHAFFFVRGWQKAHFAEGREGFYFLKRWTLQSFLSADGWQRKNTSSDYFTNQSKSCISSSQNHMLCFQLTVFFDPEAALRGSWWSVWWLRAAKNHLIGFLDLFSLILSPAPCFSTFKLAPRRGRATSLKPTSPKVSPLGEELLLLARFQGNSEC